MKTSEPHTGFFITIEGCDGVGKTTHSFLLAESLKKSLDVVSIREPGGTKTGELIRDLVKGKIDVSPMAELLLFQAARAELVEKIIKPALLAKKIVIADRFIDSTIAYQGYGRGIKIDDIHILNGISSDNIIPNVSILLDLPISKSLNRSNNRDQKRQRTQTRFEDESIEFHKKVLQGFRSIAKENPARWDIVNTSENKKLVAKKILNIITAKLDKIYY